MRRAGRDWALSSLMSRLAGWRPLHHHSHGSKVYFSPPNARKRSGVENRASSETLVHRAVWHPRAHPTQPPTGKQFEECNDQVSAVRTVAGASCWTRARGRRGRKGEEGLAKTSGKGLAKGQQQIMQVSRAWGGEEILGGCAQNDFFSKMKFNEARPHESPLR